MKNIQIFLVFFILSAIALTSHATDYYFSVSGNDGNAGTSVESPFRSIARANALHLYPGDRLLFKRGEIFRGELEVIYSGTVAQPITITSYGSGPDAVISGSEYLNDWVSVGNGIFKAACPVYPQMVFQNGEAQTLGRFPNQGFLFTDAGNGNNGFSDNDLPDKTNLYVGAGVHIRTARFRYEERIISAQSGGYLGFDRPALAVIVAGAGYYLTGKLHFVDEGGEYWYDEAEKQLYLKTRDGSSPADNTIEASRYENGIKPVSCANLVINNITFRHQQKNGVRIYGAITDNLSVDNCVFTQIYLYAITGANKNGLTITNSRFSDIWNGAIFIGGITNVNIENNVFDRIGIAAPGRATDDLISYKCINMNGSSGHISDNIIDSIGNNGIEFFQNTIIERNLISHFCMATDDGAGIVSFGTRDGIRNGTGSIVRHNVVHDAVGTWESYPMIPEPFVNGMGMDDNSGNAIFENNTVYNISGRGISIHNSSGNQIRNNTVFNCSNGSLVFEHDDNGGMLSNNAASGNILYNIHENEYALKIMNWHQSETGLNFGSFSGNYYINPYNAAAVYTAEFGNAGGGTFGLLQKNYSVSGWRGIGDVGAIASPVMLENYKVLSVAGDDMVTNGSFEQNMNGWGCYAENFTCSSGWLNDGKLDGGYAHVSSPYYDYGNFYNTELVTLQKGKQYLLSYSVVGEENRLAAFNIQDRSTWAQLTPRAIREVAAKRLEHKILLTPNENTSSGQLTFYVGPEYTPLFNLDNIKLQEVVTASINPLTQNLFYVNTSNENITIELPGIFLDVDSNVVSGSVILAPFTSKIFIAMENSVLPLHILNIEALALNDGNSRVEWRLANADEFCTMEIQKSIDGTRFDSLEEINVDRNVLRYQFVDSNFSATSFYRLRLNCTSEQVSYSKVVRLEKKMQGLEVYPNPLTGNRLNVFNPGDFSVARIYNTDGRKLLTASIRTGANVLILPSDITGGVYILVLEGTGMRSTVKLLKE